MKKFAVFFFLFFAIQLLAQTVPEDITIYRDSYGVPHVHGKTDRDVAYGLAWAHAEDDFKNDAKYFSTLKSINGKVCW